MVNGPVCVGSCSILFSPCVRLCLTLFLLRFVVHTSFNVVLLCSFPFHLFFLFFMIYVYFSLSNDFMFCILMLCFVIRSRQILSTGHIVRNTDQLAISAAHLTSKFRATESLRLPRLTLDVIPLWGNPNIF